MTNEESVDEDVELLSRIAGGGARGERALAELYVRHERRLLRFLQGSCRLDEHSAKDIEHDAFLKVWKTADSFRGGSKVSSWLHQIVKNLHIDQLRRSNRFVDVPSAAEGRDEVDTSEAQQVLMEGNGNIQDDAFQ